MRKMIFLDPSSSFPIEENRESRTPNTVMEGSGPKNKKQYILSEYPSPEHSFFN